MVDRMFSPWRSQHLDTFKTGASAGIGPDESVFTRIAEEGDDDSTMVVHRGRLVFVVMNVYPYNNGHVLIVPYRKVSRFSDLTPEERVELTETTYLAVEWIQRALSPEGFNIGINDGAAAGAGIPDHIHAHVVPRWSGDTNFMPTVADTKVVPQSIRESYERIRAQIGTNP